MAIWDAIREAMGWLLAFFYSIIPNAGVAIILLTVVVRLILFPLTAKQAKSMIAMQRVQPEIKKLQAKYKNDRQKLNEEMMKFYKENQINPLGGCLPLLAQMPVFIALYQTLRSIQDFIPTSSQMFADICTPKGGNPCATVSLDFFGMDLTQSASTAKGGFGSALPYFVLAALVVVTAYYQQRQTMRYQTAPNPQMQVIGKIMPLVFGMFAISMPAGVVLYFFTSNLWQIGQQEVVYRTIGTPAGPAPKKGTIDAKSSERPPRTTGGGIKGLFRTSSALQPGSEPEGEGANGSESPPKGKAAGGGAKGKSAGGKETPDGGAPRRRNTRKRKR